MNDRQIINVKFGYYTYLKLVCEDAGYVAASSQIQKELDDELIQRMCDAAKVYDKCDTNNNKDQKTDFCGRPINDICSALIKHAGKYSPLPPSIHL
jgi:hypothetical protein